MNKKALFTLLISIIGFSQSGTKKEILMLSIDNHENILSHTQEADGCIDIFYIKSMSKFSTLYGFKTLKPKMIGGVSPEKFKSFSEVFDKIKDRGRVEVLNYFSQYYIIFVEKDKKGNDEDYIHYHVKPFVISI